MEIDFFDKVYIHQFDLKPVVAPIDISFLKSDLPEINQELQKLNYLLPIPKEHKILAGGEKFDLGDVTIEVIFTPGHTPGSICLFTNKGELFVGDLISYGAIYFPSKDKMYLYKGSLETLSNQFRNKSISVFPAHENYDLKISIFEELLEFLNDEIFLNKNRKYDAYLDAWVLEVGKFLFVYPKE